MEEATIQEGLDIITAMWYNLASKIVEMAIQVYHLDDNQAMALKDIFLRGNDYYAELSS